MMKEEKKSDLVPLWSTPQLDAFIGDVAGLSQELKANLVRIREIDEQVQSRKTSLFKRARTLVTDAVREKDSGNITEVGKEHQEVIAKEFTEITNQSDMKYQIASDTYDLVDKHTCRLDKALKSLEEELRSQRRMASLYDSTSSGLGDKNNKKGGRSAGRSGGQVRKQQVQGRASSARKAADLTGNPVAGAVVEQQLMDMKVDPHEPTYCYCNRVSFGNMVGCDNDDCPWEWFHIDCVGIAANNMPKGKWFCPECRKAMRNKR